MVPAVWPLLLVIATASSTWLKPNYLTELDFLNAAELPPPTRRARHLYHDIRFSKRRAKRSGGVAVSSQADKAAASCIATTSVLGESQRAVIAQAIAGYQARTCIRFVPKAQTDRDYIVISKLDGCYADFARVGGRQQVSLADECMDYATIIHELMHVVGFIHEHQRADRDNYVDILYQNIILGANSDFDKLTQLDLSYYGEGYDYLSIMHYESDEGSKNGRNTIEAKDPRYTPLMGKGIDFSPSDLRRLNRAYTCYGYYL
ncbi:unnamed protein product [Cylicocyclus nassatus]|uniref:Metalloendopeptidase n=1 Tax=Cylicocyclus nassatus TaxID=53992 RepID=A0AA36GRC2_CYLNA|nr:unnamed protein product [Cylicocyclus nassatus]